MRKALARTVASLTVLAAASVAGEREGRACGACFHQEVEVEPTVVNEHRMVFAISRKHTVLWDQIQYSGNPKEFAWVLPVARGTVVQVSRDEWIAALDATTQPRVIAPRTSGGFGDDGYGDGDGEGCNPGCGSTTFETMSGAGSSSSGGEAAPPPVQVVSQAVVGPYETVTLRSEDPQALQTWLHGHGYAVPASIEPVIASYAASGLDFIALRLRPGQGIRAMRPVRIVTPGADLTLPLRMVAAGAGASVGITLFVIAEGRYRPQSFPEVAIDPSKVLWNAAEGRSNYQELASQTIAGSPDQRGWLVEWANPALTSSTLQTAYLSSCSQVTPNTPPPVPDDPVDPATDAATGDAATDDAGAAPDAGSSLDAGTASSDCPADIPTACCHFDDLDVAVDGMYESDVWVTRLRANLPAAALDVDLHLEAAPKQEIVSGVYNAYVEPSPTASIAPLARGRVAGSATLTAAVALVVARLLRRPRRGERR